MSRILLVDDEEDIRSTLATFLLRDGHEVDSVGDAPQALALLNRKEFDILVTDIFLPKISGVELLAAARKQYPRMLALLMTGEPTVETASQAVREGAFDYLAKPVSGQTIRRVVAAAAQLKSLHDENAKLEEQNKQYRQSLEAMVAARTAELSQANQRLELLVAGSRAALWERDPAAGKFTYVGGMLEEIFGHASANWYDTQFWMDRALPEDRAALAKIFEPAAEPPPEPDVEFRMLSASGTPVWVAMYMSPLVQDGRYAALRGVLVDVSRRKQAEDELEELSEKLRAAEERQEAALLANLDLGGPRQALPAAKGEPFFGTSAVMQKLRKIAELAAEHDEAVLFDGETGTGKGVLAKWIHERSRRAKKPMVSLNCSALRGDLLASELFGHVKGAFTSAAQDRKGLIEEADGGTLFLDEIGEMDPAVQAQFLKVLEEKTFRRVGETKTRSSDFRLVCATNRNLAAEADAGRFRRDLFFRINVFPIHIPALRDRLEDFPGLTAALLHSYEAAKHCRLAPETVAFLQEYHWPGNVRELNNVLIRAVLLARQGAVLPQHFPGLDEAPAQAEPLITVGAPAKLGTAPEFANEEEEIIALLRRFRGNRIKTAAAMGISRATLYRKMRKMDMEP